MRSRENIRRLKAWQAKVSEKLKSNIPQERGSVGLELIAKLR